MTEPVSPMSAEFCTALADFQADLEPVKKAHRNDYGNYNYAELGDYIEATKAARKKHHFSIVQILQHADDMVVVVETMLIHPSGSISGQLRMPIEPKKGMSIGQAVGATITYARKYAYAAICGLAAEEDLDSASVAGMPSGPRRQPYKRPETPPQPPKQTEPPDIPPAGPEDLSGKITAAQQKRLWAIAREVGLTQDGVKELLAERMDGMESTKDLDQDQYNLFIEAMRETKE